MITLLNLVMDLLIITDSAENHSTKQKLIDNKFKASLRKTTRETSNSIFSDLSNQPVSIAS